MALPVCQATPWKGLGLTIPVWWGSPPLTLFPRQGLFADVSFVLWSLNGADSLGEARVWLFQSRGGLNSTFKNRLFFLSLPFLLHLLFPFLFAKDFPISHYLFYFALYFYFFSFSYKRNLETVRGTQVEQGTMGAGGDEKELMHCVHVPTPPR